MSRHATVDEIRQRFDQDVERFSNLQTGQSATIDAPLVLELLSEAATATTPDAKDLLDVGCGAGNNSLKLLSRLPNLNVTLLDLSRPMLDRAKERVSAATPGSVITLQSDIRQFNPAPNSLDIILAAAVLHHLRTDEEWQSVFAMFHRALRPGGSIWISDLITHTAPALQTLMWNRYGDYLTQLNGPDYRQKVFDYVAYEDTPRPLMYQLDLLRSTGFTDLEVLHKTSVFAAFGAKKP